MTSIPFQKIRVSALTRTTRRERRGMPEPVVRVVAPTLATLLGLTAWQVASARSDGWLPSVGKMVGAFGDVFASDTLVEDFTVTMRRVLIVWIASLFVGLVVGVAAGFKWWLRAYLRPILAIALAVPDLVYIIMVVLVLGTGEAPPLVALVLAISPLVVNVTMSSVMARDKRLDEMAKTYRLSPTTYARNVLWWQLRPAVRAGTRTAFAFSWKLIVLAETISASNGIGSQISREFKFLRADGMIAYALLFIVAMRLIEVLVVDRLLGDGKKQATFGR